jgi:hypothetical protein
VVAGCCLHLVHLLCILPISFGLGSVCIPAVSALAWLLASSYGPLGIVLGLMTACTEAIGSFIRIDAFYISILLAVKALVDVSGLVIQDCDQYY